MPILEIDGLGAVKNQPLEKQRIRKMHPKNQKTLVQNVTAKWLWTTGKRNTSAKVVVSS